MQQGRTTSQGGLPVNPPNGGGTVFEIVKTASGYGQLLRARHAAMPDSTAEDHAGLLSGVVYSMRVITSGSQISAREY